MRGGNCKLNYSKTTFCSFSCIFLQTLIADFPGTRISMGTKKRMVKINIILCFSVSTLKLKFSSSFLRLYLHYIINTYKEIKSFAHTSVFHPASLAIKVLKSPSAHWVDMHNTSLHSFCHRYLSIIFLCILAH